MLPSLEPTVLIWQAVYCVKICGVATPRGPQRIRLVLYSMALLVGLPQA